MLAGALLAAGCSRGGSDEEQVDANAATQSEVNVPIPAEPAAPAIKDASNDSASAENLVAPADQVSEEQQMIEDAEATGMTSRVGSDPAAEGEQPAQDSSLAQ